MKAIVLKRKGSIMIVEITIHRQYGNESLFSCVPFQTASHSVSSGPWIPMTPDSHDESDLDRQWEEDHEADNNGSWHLVWGLSRESR
jgi:hypothetical protein